MHTATLDGVGFDETAANVAQDRTKTSANASTWNRFHVDAAMKRPKSLTQSIRARLSRSSTREDEPVPSLTSSSSSIASLQSSPSMPCSAAFLNADLTPGHPSIISQADLDAAWSTITPPAFPTPLRYTSCYCEENVYLLIQSLCSKLATINTAAANEARKQSPRFVQSKCSVSPTPSPAPTLFVPVWDLHAIFISNAGKSVLLYQQNASKLPNAGSPVVWDYHVIAAVTCHLVPLRELVLPINATFAAPACSPHEAVNRSRSWIYDYDSRLSNPAGQINAVPFDAYNQHTFHPAAIEAGIIPEHFQPWFRVVPANDFVDMFASDRSHMLALGTNDGEGEKWNSPPPIWEPIVGPRASKMGVTNNLMDRYVDVVAKDANGWFGKVWNAERWLRQTSVAMGSKVGATVGESGSKGDLPSNDHGSSSRNDSPTAMQSVGTPNTRPAFGSAILGDGDGAEGRKGGRIASPLFPAYLHASQQYRSRLAPPPTPTSPL